MARTQYAIKPATDKQIDLIRKLAAEKQWESNDCGPARDVAALVTDGEEISCRDASSAIDFLFSCPRRPQPAEDIAKPGYYVRDGIVYVVVLNREGTATYAKRMVIDHETRRGSWRYAPNIGRSLAREGLAPLTALEAATLGRLHGCCVACGRTLTDPASVERGIGPVCRKRVQESFDRISA